VSTVHVPGSSRERYWVRIQRVRSVNFRMLAFKIAGCRLHKDADCGDPTRAAGLPPGKEAGAGRPAAHGFTLVHPVFIPDQDAGSPLDQCCKGLFTSVHRHLEQRYRGLAHHPHS
jgi:hypothetical protein